MEPSQGGCGFSLCFAIHDNNNNNKNNSLICIVVLTVIVCS